MIPPLHDDGDTNPQLDSNAVEAFDKFVCATGAVIVERALPWDHDNGQYDPETDQILLRERVQWYNRPVGYYCTLSHELIHWTGTRLGRITSEEPTGLQRTFEELVAEYGSVALMKHFGVYAPRPGGNERVRRYLAEFSDPTSTIAAVHYEVAKAVDYLLEVSRTSRSDVTE